MDILDAAYIHGFIRRQHPRLRQNGQNGDNVEWLVSTTIRGHRPPNVGIAWILLCGVFRHCTQRIILLQSTRTQTDTCSSRYRSTLHCPEQTSSFSCAIHRCRRNYGFLII